MTTIATDGKSMAADGVASRNDVITADQLVKIERLSDGSLLGVSGRSSTQSKLAAWLGGKGDFPKDCGDWGAIHLVPGEARYYSADAETAYLVLSLPAATGSGNELAIGAMLFGATPEEAVLVASKRDPFTGGLITKLDLTA